MRPSLLKQECWSGIPVLFLRTQQGPGPLSKRAVQQQSPGFNGEGETQTQSNNPALAQKKICLRSADRYDFNLAGGQHRNDAMPPVSAFMQSTYLILFFTSFLTIPLAR